MRQEKGGQNASDLVAEALGLPIPDSAPPPPNHHTEPRRSRYAAPVPTTLYPAVPPPPAPEVAVAPEPQTPQDASLVASREPNPAIYDPIPPGDDVGALLAREALLEQVLEPIVGGSYLPPLHAAWTVYAEKGDVAPFRGVLERLRLFAINTDRAETLAELAIYNGNQELAEAIAVPMRDCGLTDREARAAWERRIGGLWAEHEKDVRMSGLDK